MGIRNQAFLPFPKTPELHVIVAAEVLVSFWYVTHRFPSANADVDNLGNENKVESIVDTLHRDLRLRLS